MARSDMPRKSLRLKRRADLLTALLFLAPSALTFGFFTYYALGFNVYLSFTSWNFLSPTKRFIGLENYASLFSDPRVWRVMLNTLYFASTTVLLSIVVGLGLALLLNRKIPARGFIRSLIFTPYITTTAAVALLWIWIFQPRFGLINYLLSFVGIQGPAWLTSTVWAMPAIIIMEVWRSIGYTMVVYLAGLTGIPRDLYEAAALDGASPWRNFLHITLPMLSPTTFFLFTTGLIGAFQVFDSIAVMTEGGPANATKVFNYYIYEQAFTSFRAGYAASGAIVLFAAILLVTLFQFSISRRWVHYQ